ncbi:MAG: alkaline phosphatase family protein [Chitinispirillia bacterium]|jgi:predicted AlkP superfamily phosphohydrolase/phosphomutase
MIKYRAFQLIVTLMMITFSQAQEKKFARVILIGIDGMSVNVISPLLNKGLLPNISKLLQTGGQGELDSFWPLRTMQVWTSIATGKLPGQHGIWDHAKHSNFNPEKIRSKKKGYYYSNDRKCKAIWHLLGDNGISNTFIGWTTTWPAESINNGIMVAPKVLYGDERSTTIKGSFWKHVKETVTPVEYESIVKQNIVEPHNVSDKDLELLASIPEEKSPLYNLPKIKQYVYTLRWGFARAKSIEKITLALFKKNPTDVVSFYFQGTDSYLHRFWIFQKNEDEIIKRLKQFNIDKKYAPLLKKHFGNVVANCYREVDQRIGRILDEIMGSNTLVILVSDHGFGDGPKERHPFSAEPYGGIHWSKAMIIASGSTIKNGTVIKNASVLDIVPSLLHYFQLPVAKDMPGKILKDLFNASHQLQKPAEIIESYEKEPQFEVPFNEYHITPKTFIW